LPILTDPFFISSSPSFILNTISPDDKILFTNFEKEWNDVQQIIGDTPFLQLQNLLPIVAKARVEQVMGN